MDSDILALHRQGFATGAIALRLKLSPSHVRQVVCTHLEAVAQTSKDHYSKTTPRQKARDKVAQAQAALDAAARELADLNGH